MKALALAVVIVSGCLMPTMGQAQGSVGNCTYNSVVRSQLQAVTLIRSKQHASAWLMAHSVGRCYGELSVFEEERVHYQEMYLAGVFCLLAFESGKDVPRLTSNDDGSLLLMNDLMYGATMLQSIVDDNRAPRDIRTNARTVLVHLVAALKHFNKSSHGASLSAASLGVSS